jgi:NACalpha-BTF3-like transcription factor
MDNEDGETNSSEKTSIAKHDRSGAADLERITDYAEEKEISAGSLNNAMNAMNAISDKRKTNAEQKAEREKHLASIKVKKEDIEIIVNEFEIAKQRAERVLKENNGDLEAALSSLINA